MKSVGPNAALSCSGRGCVRNTSRSTSIISHPLQQGLRLKPRAERSMLYVHPHPSPLPQERENRSPVSPIAETVNRSVRFDAAAKPAAITIATSKFSSDARLVSPLPGGEGQDEGERHD